MSWFADIKIRYFQPHQVNHYEQLHKNDKITLARYHIFEYKPSYCVKDPADENNNENSNNDNGNSAVMSIILTLELLTFLMLL